MFSLSKIFQKKVAVSDMQTLYILLGDDSISFCHYSNKNSVHRLISIETMKKGIDYAKQHNMRVVIVCPDTPLPEIYQKYIRKAGIKIICSYSVAKDYIGQIDTVVTECWEQIDSFAAIKADKHVLRTTKDELFLNWQKIPVNQSIDMVLSDVDSFTEQDLEQHHCILANLADKFTEQIKEHTTLSANILTSRIFLKNMHNCQAAISHITLAPDGNWYTCPGFYYSAMKPLGNIDSPLEIKNEHLFHLEYAPICKHCDAYQCKRCIWLNRLMTLEVNTPSHQQCVISHNERNASRQLLVQLQDCGIWREYSIKEIHYLDPFEVQSDWNYIK